MRISIDITKADNRRVNGRETAKPIHAPESISGGENDPLRGKAAEIAREMQRIFALQYHYAVDRKIWNTNEIEWVTGDEWEKSIYDSTHNLIGAFAERGAKQGGDKIGVSITDYVDRPQAITAIRDETFKFAKAAGISSRESLRFQLEEAQSNGETVPQITARIKTVFGYDPEAEIYVPRDAATGPIENWRAERIARTESANALTVGERDAWKMSTVVQRIQWDASGDACPFCLSMHNQSVPIGDSFFKIGDELAVPFNGKIIVMNFRYRDVMGPPLHPNCRCGETAELVDIL